MMLPDNDADLIQDFREFVLSRDANEVYDYSDTKCCAFAQYLHYKGYAPERVSVGPWEWHLEINGGEVQTQKIPYEIHRAVCWASHTPGDENQYLPRTFGRVLAWLDHFQENPGDIHA